MSTTATLRVVYDQPDFWNVNNLIIYEPCAGFTGYQGFLGISKGTPSRPFREASATWTTPLKPFTCSSVYCQVETDKLYSVDQAGTRTMEATLSGNLNAIGYNELIDKERMDSLSAA